MKNPQRFYQEILDHLGSVGHISFRYGTTTKIKGFRHPVTYAIVQEMKNLGLLQTRRVEIGERFPDGTLNNTGFVQNIYFPCVFNSKVIA